MRLLDNAQFLVELERLFEKSRNGSVFMTVKRFNPIIKKADKLKAKTENPDKQYPCLVRVTNGKQKISTLAQPSDLFIFQSNYMTLLKLKVNTLKKKDKRAKGAKDKEEAEAPAKEAPKESKEATPSAKGKEKPQEKGKENNRQQRIPCMITKEGGRSQDSSKQPSFSSVSCSEGKPASADCPSTN